MIVEGNVGADNHSDYDVDAPQYNNITSRELTFLLRLPDSLLVADTAADETHKSKQQQQHTQHTLISIIYFLNSEVV